MEIELLAVQDPEPRVALRVLLEKSAAAVVLGGVGRELPEEDELAALAGQAILEPAQRLFDFRISAPTKDDVVAQLVARGLAILERRLKLGHDLACFTFWLLGFALARCLKTAKQVTQIHDLLSLFKRPIYPCGL
jgi:hypothetical protein